MTENEKLKKVGVHLPKILLPNKGVDYSLFAAIACDQFTSQPAYWDRAYALTGDKPSALNLILPEAYLEETPDLTAEIEKINSNMSTYLESGTLTCIGESFVYLRRGTTTGIRYGLVVALDLEEYDFSESSSSKIRATEKTVVERLPSRVDIRRNAPLEIPHVMVLVDDSSNLLMGTLEQLSNEKKPLYDFDLMQDGGHVQGFQISEEAEICSVADILLKLEEESKGGMLFAVGDGNHSLAAAKLCYEEIKKSPEYSLLSAKEKEGLPARYVLVELVNLHDPALMMEPIHRVVFGVDREKFLSELDIELSNLPSIQDLQPRLDKWLEKNPHAKLDYIHGAQEAKELGENANNVALVFDDFDKNSLFDTVLEKGVLVRKSFSMGEARDKRYYLESRRIK